MMQQVSLKLNKKTFMTSINKKVNRRAIVTLISVNRKMIITLRRVMVPGQVERRAISRFFRVSIKQIMTILILVRRKVS